MTGRHVAERAAAYWANDIADGERAIIDEHLVTCEACHREFQRVHVALDALRSWPADATLPPTLSDRIVARALAMRNERRWIAGWTPGRAAAVIGAIACGLAGFILGRATSSRANGAEQGSAPAASAEATVDSTLRPFLLLLEERSWPPPQPLTRPGYGEWTRAIRAEARYVGAEKLTEEPGYRIESDGRVVRPEASARPPNVSGWYVVRARSYEEAIDWARRGPHLAYGSVLVREVER